jgi:hypothetical protein
MNSKPACLDAGFAMPSIMLCSMDERIVINDARNTTDLMTFPRVGTDSGPKKAKITATLGKNGRTIRVAYNNDRNQTG